MPVASKDKLYKSKSTGQWYKADPTVTTGDLPGFRKATPREISEYEAGPINIEPGDALSLGKRFKVVNFATNADELTEFLRTGEPHLVIKKYGGRPHDLAISQDGGKTYRLIDPAPKRYAVTQAMRASRNLTAPVLAEAAMAMVTDPVEFGKDMLDIAYDTLAGIATAKATMAGAVAGPATGTAAGAGMELLRQKIGQGMGVSKRLDPLAIGVGAAAGGVMPAASSGVKMLRAGKPLVEESAAFLTGAKGDIGIPATDVVKKRIRVSTPARTRVSDIENDASALRRTIAQIKQEHFPEKDIADAMEEAATGEVNFVDLMEPLSQLTRKETGEQAVTTTSRLVRATDEAFETARSAARDASQKGTRMQRGKVQPFTPTDTGQMMGKPYSFGSDIDKEVVESVNREVSELGKQSAKVDRTTTTTKFVKTTGLQSFEAEGKALADSNLPDDASDLIDWGYRMLKQAGVEDPTKVPAKVAARIKDYVWDSLPEQTFNGRPVSDAFRKVRRDFGGRIADATATAVDSTVDPAAHGTHLKYSQLMEKMKGKRNQLDYWQQASGVWEYKTKELADGTIVTLSDKVMLDEATGTAKMVGFGTNLWGKNRHFIERAVEQFRQDFGIDMREALEKMALSQKIGMKGSGGAMQMRPHIASAGGIPMTGAVLATIGGGGGLAGYAATGSPLYGALSGLASLGAAGTLASPAFIVGAGRSAVGPAMGAAGRAVEGAAASQVGKSSAVMGLNEAVRQMRQRRGPYPGQTVEYR